MFNNSIYSNPAGWAVRIVGTNRRYITVSAVTALTGCFIILLVSFRITLIWQLLIIPPVFIVTIELPLYCLRALRSVVKGYCNGQARSPSTIRK